MRKTGQKLFDKKFFKEMAYQFFYNNRYTPTLTRKDYVLWLISKKNSKELGSFNVLYNNITRRCCKNLFEIRNNNIYRKKIQQILSSFTTDELNYYAEACSALVARNSIESKILFHMNSKNKSLPQIIADYLHMPKNKFSPPDISGIFIIEILELCLNIKRKITKQPLCSNKKIRDSTWRYIQECRLNKSSPQKRVLDDYLLDNHNDILLKEWFDVNIQSGIWERLPLRKKKLIRNCSQKADMLFCSFNLLDLADERKFACLYYNLYCYINKKNYLKDFDVDWDKVANLMFTYCFSRLKTFAIQYNRLPNYKSDYMKQFHSALYYMNNIEFLIESFDIPNQNIEVYNKFILKYSSKFQSKGEQKVAGELIDLGFNVIMQKRFPDCKNINILPFDIFSDSGSRPFIIEVDGPHHFAPVEFWGGDINFQRVKHNDVIKNKYCQEHGILLFRIPYCELNRSKVLIQAFLNDNNIHNQ